MQSILAISLRHLTETSAHKVGRDDDTIEWLPPVPAAVHPSYVVDKELTIRHFLSLVLHGSGIDTVEVADSAARRKA